MYEKNATAGRFVTTVTLLSVNTPGQRHEGTSSEKSLYRRNASTAHGDGRGWRRNGTLLLPQTPFRQQRHLHLHLLVNSPT